MQLAGKSALITGTAKGLGKAFAASLLRNGAKVCLSDVDAALGQATYEEYKKEFGEANVIFKQCDVRNNQAIKDLFDKVRREYKTLDIMVNNAGIANELDVENVVAVNLVGVIQGTMMAMDCMKKDNGGHGGVIVNIGSMAGIIPVPSIPVYAATKHGVVAFTRSWALHPDTQNNNIRLVCLCPAYTDTDIIKNVTGSRVQGEDLALKSLQELGLMSVDTVVDGFMKLLQDTDNNGKALCMVKGMENQYK